jgi:hypothetical protein
MARRKRARHTCIRSSNALWNLLPAARGINANKSDRIPDPALVHARRDAITACWHTLEDAYSRRVRRAHHERQKGVAKLRKSSASVEARLRAN